MIERKRRSGLDSIEDTVTTLSRQSHAAQAEEQVKPYAGRGKPGHAGQKGVDKTGRHKITADVAPGRKEQVEEMARGLGISASDVVDAALANMYTFFRRDVIDLAEHRTFVPDEEKPGRGIWKLALPEEFTFGT